MPKVTVIIPTYNRREFISRAVASVLAQTRPVHEIIVVDDGSNDNTKDVLPLNSPTVRYLYQENGGPSSARNAGVRLAEGDVLGFLDSDDFWPKERLALQLALMNRHPQADIVSGRLQWVRSAPIADNFENMGHPVHNFSNLGPSLFKKSCFDRVGLFNTDLHLGEDMDWHLRAVESGLVRILHDGVMVYYRRHASNITANPDDTHQSMLLAIQRSLERRRRNTQGIFTPALSPWTFLSEPQR